MPPDLAADNGTCEEIRTPSLVGCIKRSLAKSLQEMAESSNGNERNGL